MIKDDSFVKQISSLDSIEDAVNFLTDFRVVDTFGQLPSVFILFSVFLVMLQSKDSCQPSRVRK